MSKLNVLYEASCGYSLYNVKEYEEIGTFIPAIQKSVNDVAKFKSVVRLLAFVPFTNATVSLNNANAISEGIVSDELKNFLETNFPKSSKASLGVSDSKLASAIGDSLNIKVEFGGVVPEILRGIRVHMSSIIKELTPATISQAELGLAHSYSRMAVKYNINKADTMITQSIALLDQLDKDINLFAMRIREWYSYHFPELAKIVTDNKTYSMCASLIGDRTEMTRDLFDDLEEATKDSTQTEAIFEASRMSMGMDISEIDLCNIKSFARRVVDLSSYKQNLAEYLKSKMSTVAPNLSSVMGEVVGARLISHAGSLINLAKVPASTVQILGAEKALFRAIKNRSNTPKYGLIYHSSFISRAGAKNKGRISRFLANKASLATRIDCFADDNSNVFGMKLREQVEERLNFFESGDVPRKNTEVMEEAVAELKLQAKAEGKRKRKSSNNTEITPKKKRKSTGSEETNVGKKSKKSIVKEETDEEDLEEIPKKKKKKMKKEK